MAARGEIPGRHGGGLRLCACRPPAKLLYRDHGGGPVRAPPPPAMLVGTVVLVCGPWWHFAWYCAKLHGRFGTGECRCQTEPRGLRFPTPAPLFFLQRAQIPSAPVWEPFFRPLAGLWPKRLPEPLEKPCQTDPQRVPRFEIIGFSGVSF
jgi:hypothetical protein